MYFPKNFDLKKAQELADLVTQAYEQYEACDKKKKWELRGNYDLVHEINYKPLQTELIYETKVFFERELKSLLKSPKSIYTGIYTGLPIGFIARKYDNIYVIFRGTMTTTEWLRNLDFDLKPYPERNFGKVHEGFLQIFNSLQDSILNTLSGAPRFKKVYVAGHSLGGALATILVPILQRSFPRVRMKIYTYGSPRVGNAAFVDQYNRLFSNRTFRVANTSDLVTAVPFPARFMGFFGGLFTHVDTPVVFTTQKGELELNHRMEVYSNALVTARQSGAFRVLLKRFLQFFNQ